MAKRRAYRGRRNYGTFTPKRKAALKKAQIVSARKRSRGAALRSHVSRHRKAYAAGAAVAALGAGAVVRHRFTGSSFGTKTNPIVSTTGHLSGTRPAHVTYAKHTARGFSGSTHTISVTTRKRGPLGKSKTYSYTHVPLRTALFGNRSSSMIDRSAEPYNPTVKRSWPAEKNDTPAWLKPKVGVLTTAGPAPNRDVYFGKYERGYFPRRSNFDMKKRMAAINKRHGL